VDHTKKENSLKKENLGGKRKVGDREKNRRCLKRRATTGGNERKKKRGPYLTGFGDLNSSGREGGEAFLEKENVVLSYETWSYWKKGKTFN